MAMGAVQPCRISYLLSMLPCRMVRYSSAVLCGIQLGPLTLGFMTWQSPTVSCGTVYQQHAVWEPDWHRALRLAAGTADGAVMLKAGFRQLERATVLAGAEEGTAAEADALDQQPYWRAAPVPQTRGIMAS